MPKDATTPQRTLLICAKCSDMFNVQLIVDDRVAGTYDGYVPDWMPGEHYGDYVELEIDVDTGSILNWKRPSQKALDATFKPKETA